MSSSDPVHAEADAILRLAAKPDRLWPIAIGVLILYLAGSIWRLDRPFGDTGRDAVLHAAPTLWVPLLLAAVVIGGRWAGSVEARAGGSPWRWPRVARRVLIALAVALPLISFGVAPAAAIIAADAGTTDVGPPLTLVVDLTVDVH